MLSLSMQLRQTHPAPVNQAAWTPPSPQNDNTSSQYAALYHWGLKKNVCVVAWEGLTGSRLRLMQIVREIRLPVSVVVDGSHRSSALTVDRKGGNMEGLATVEQARASGLHSIFGELSPVINSHHPNWIQRHSTELT